MKLKNMMAALVLGLAILLTNSTFAASKMQVSGVVNINTATHEQLLLLPGIGDVKADAIIAQRQLKPFGTTEDLLAIKGIGEKMLAKMNPLVVTHGETTLHRDSVALASEAVKPVAK